MCNLFFIIFIEAIRLPVIYVRFPLKQFIILSDCCIVFFSFCIIYTVFFFSICVVPLFLSLSLSNLFVRLPFIYNRLRYASLSRHTYVAISRHTIARHKCAQYTQRRFIVFTLYTPLRLMQNALVVSKSCGKIAGRCRLSLQSLPQTLSYCNIIIQYSRETRTSLKLRRSWGRHGSRRKRLFFHLISLLSYNILRDPLQTLIAYMSSSLVIILCINNNHVKLKVQIYLLPNTCTIINIE